MDFNEKEKPILNVFGNMHKFFEEFAGFAEGGRLARRGKKAAYFPRANLTMR